MMDKIIKKIKQVAMKYDIDKIVLFGSRAIGSHMPASDYDIAVYSHNLSDIDKASFSADIEEIHTLKKIDMVFANEGLKDELMAKIERDGVIIYE